MVIEASQWETVVVQGGRNKQTNGAGEGLSFKGQQGDMTFCVRFTAGTQALIPLIKGISS